MGERRRGRREKGAVCQEEGETKEGRDGGLAKHNEQSVVCFFIYLDYVMISGADQDFGKRGGRVVSIVSQ